MTALRNRGSREGGESTTSGPGESAEASLSTAQPVGAPAEDTIDSARSDDDETTTSPSDTAPDTAADSRG